ncbi:hypothetical protein LAZ67_23000472 [Cordylochernes scorpioides]|uniref:Reverse transcriptase RNase H-like domain-containing protein n=1 Tax=Cordylochernes scorpioides TaxID=51811 RepID=A0ABY6LRY5_9ARAC|nr:hypothetical protein LAZ67_23000472 [Cordylochernes scorpioides]
MYWPIGWSQLRWHSSVGQSGDIDICGRRHEELPPGVWMILQDDRAVGSVLQQLDNNTWKPIAFFSKKLNPAQCNYSTYDRELLAIYLSIKFFKHLLEAREFTILTDHKPLIYAFKQKNEKASPIQLRHLQYISQFTTDIKYIKGTDNIVADALSRVDAITTIDYEEIAKNKLVIQNYKT